MALLKKTIPHCLSETSGLQWAFTSQHATLKGRLKLELWASSLNVNFPFLLSHFLLSLKFHLHLFLNLNELMSSFIARKTPFHIAGWTLIEKAEVALGMDIPKPGRIRNDQIPFLNREFKGFKFI